MTPLEFWTMARFLLYPVMLVSGLAWALFMLRYYRRTRCFDAAWSFWLGLAVAVQGASGFSALLVSRTQGFGSLSSGIFTVGALAVTVTVATGALAMWLTAWRRR